MTLRDKITIEQMGEYRSCACLTGEEKCKMFTTEGDWQIERAKQWEDRAEQRQEETEVFASGDMYVIQYWPCIRDDSFHECGSSDETWLHPCTPADSPLQDRAGG